jgi:hypothetical protein
MPTGNPFKPKAVGYSAPTDPVGKLNVLFDKMAASVENLYHGFQHLGDAVKAMDRMASRVAFLSVVAAGPRSNVPYDLRDVLRAQGARPGGSHQQAFGRNPVSPVAGPGSPPPLPGRPPVGSPANGLPKGTWWVKVPPPPAPPKGPPPLPPLGPGGQPAGGRRPDLSGPLNKAAFGSALASAALLKASSPLATDTLMKSLELALAKLGRGTVGPSGALSRNLQGVGQWADRNPGLADLVGKLAVLTAGVTVAALGVNILAKAAANASAALTWLAASARGPGGLPVPSPTGPKGPVGGLAANVAGGAAGGVATSGRFARLRSLAGRAGPFAAPVAAALDAYDSYDLARNDTESAVHKGISRGLPSTPIYSSTYGVTDAGKDLAKWGLRNFAGYSRKEVDDAQSRIDEAFESLNPFAKSNPTKGAGKGGHLTALPPMTPQILGVDEVWKSVQLSALADPLQQEIDREQMANDQKAMADAVTTGMLNYDQQKGKDPAARR